MVEVIDDYRRLAEFGTMLVVVPQIQHSPAGSKTVHRTVFAGLAVALFESLSLNTVPKKLRERENAFSQFLAE